MSKQHHVTFHPRHLKVSCPACQASKGSSCRNMTSKSGEKIANTHFERAKKARELVEKLSVNQPKKRTQNEATPRSVTHLHIHINLSSGNEPKEDRGFGPKDYSDC